MNTSKNYQFVLVHGAWHGAWCWEKVVPLLEAGGHAAHAIDLPGLGEDQTPIKDVTLESYVSAVSELINSIDQPVVLVGHSMGGMVITQVAELIPDKINTLIYLTAFSPKNRETLLQYALENTESDVTKYKQINEEEGYFTVAEDKLQACFYGKCSDEDAHNAIKQLRPQALAPVATPLKLSDENYGRVRRCYIECSKDRAITLAMQKRLKENGRVDDSAVLDTDHSPFYSCPEELAETLISLA
ncbi:MAG: alpha/beta fold hydrolase [Gammaproteobacteria bacterium]|jgi:pimeloyl-ACP methyl ester carboxylesterase|nr:alpha/beta fold hydrolase [Gammaproteobacteria bacterium]